MMLLENKVAIITGAAGGLGRFQAIEYAKEGAKVVINDVKREELSQTEQMVRDVGGEVLSIVADISIKSEVQELIQQSLDTFGKVDICVNNAAVLADFKPIGEVTEEEWDKIMSINLKGVYLLTNLILPHYLDNKKGTFINIASIGGVIAGVGDAAYITSKHGLIGFTKQLTYDYGKEGIRAVALCPGLTDTPMVNYAIEEGHPQALRQINSTPTGKIGRAEDIAYFSAYLASDRAERINGSTMIIDGGQSVGQEAKWVNPLKS